MAETDAMTELVVLHGLHVHLLHADGRFGRRATAEGLRPVLPGARPLEALRIREVAEAEAHRARLELLVPLASELVDEPVATERRDAVEHALFHDAGPVGDVDRLPAACRVREVSLHRLGPEGLHELSLEGTTREVLHAAAERVETPLLTAHLLDARDRVVHQVHHRVAKTAAGGKPRPPEVVGLARARAAGGRDAYRALGLVEAIEVIPHVLAGEIALVGAFLSGRAPERVHAAKNGEPIGDPRGDVLGDHASVVRVGRDQLTGGRIRADLGDTSEERPDLVDVVEVLVANVALLLPGHSRAVGVDDVVAVNTGVVTDQVAAVRLEDEHALRTNELVVVNLGDRVVVVAGRVGGIDEVVVHDLAVEGVGHAGRFPFRHGHERVVLRPTGVRSLDLVG